MNITQSCCTCDLHKMIKVLDKFVNSYRVCNSFDMNNAYVTGNTIDVQELIGDIRQFKISFQKKFASRLAWQIATIRESVVHDFTKLLQTPCIVLTYNTPMMKPLYRYCIHNIYAYVSSQFYPKTISLSFITPIKKEKKNSLQ